MDRVEQSQAKIGPDPGYLHVQGYVQRARCGPGGQHGQSQGDRPLRQPHQDHATGKSKQRKRDGHNLHPVQVSAKGLHRYDSADRGHGQQQAEADI